MIDCLILGDSIAVGTGMFRKECTTLAQTGITSKDYNKKYNKGSFDAETVVISLGSNDSENTQTLKELFALRQVVKAKKVYWILPANKQTKREDVSVVADKFEDKTISFSPSKDKVHPTISGYKELAEKSK